MAELLGTDVADQMSAAIRMAVRMTFEAYDPTTWANRAPVFSGVELLLRERGEQQAQTLKLLGIQDPVEQFVKVVNGHQLALGHVTKIGPSREIHGWRELRQKMVRQV